MAPVGAAGIEPTTACVQGCASMQAGCHTRPAISFAVPRINCADSREEIANPTLIYVRVGRADEARGELRVLGRCTRHPTAVQRDSSLPAATVSLVLQPTLLGGTSFVAHAAGRLGGLGVHLTLFTRRGAVLHGVRSAVVRRLRTIREESHKVHTSFPPKYRQELSANPIQNAPVPERFGCAHREQHQDSLSWNICIVPCSAGLVKFIAIIRAN